MARHKKMPLPPRYIYIAPMNRLYDQDNYGGSTWEPFPEDGFNKLIRVNGIWCEWNSFDVRDDDPWCEVCDDTKPVDLFTSKYQLACGHIMCAYCIKLLLKPCPICNESYFSFTEITGHFFKISRYIELSAYNPEKASNAKNFNLKGCQLSIFKKF